MAFDWDTFAANPAEMHIEAMDWDTGETVAWTRTDVKDAHDLGLKVRASSTMPPFHAAHHHRRAHLHGRRHGR